MMTYKDKTWCMYDKCINHYPSKCEKVLTDYNLKELKEGKYLISTYASKPDCFKQMNCIMDKD